MAKKVLSVLRYSTDSVGFVCSEPFLIFIFSIQLMSVSIFI